MSFEFNSNIPDDVVQKMQEYFFHSTDWQDVAYEVSNYIEPDDIISDVSRSVMEDIVNDHLDYDKITDYISDQVTSLVEDQVRIELNDTDFSEIVNDQVEYLVTSYSPGNGCGIGSAFTSAIHSGIVYLLESNEDLRKMIANAIKETTPEEVEPVNEPVNNEDFVPLFNPDLVGVYSVVSEICDRYLSDKQEQDPSFVIRLKMEMWQKFINSRSYYVDSVKENKND